MVTAEGDPSTFDPTIAVDGPGVASAGVVKGFGAVPMAPDGTLDLETSTGLLGPADTTAWYHLDRPLLAEGRLPAPDASDELLVPEDMRDRGFPVGSTHDFCMVDFEEAVAFGQGVVDGTATAAQRQAFVEQVCEIHHLRVVGVTRPGPDEVVLRADSEADLFPQVGPAFAAATRKPEAFSFVLVDLDSGADQGAYVDACSTGRPRMPACPCSRPHCGLRWWIGRSSLRARRSRCSRRSPRWRRSGVLGPSVLRWAGTPEADRAPLLALGMRSHPARLARALRGAAVGVVAASDRRHGRRAGIRPLPHRDRSPDRAVPRCARRRRRIGTGVRSRSC